MRVSFQRLAKRLRATAIATVLTVAALGMATGAQAHPNHDAGAGPVTSYHPSQPAPVSHETASYRASAPTLIADASPETCPRMGHGAGHNGGCCAGMACGACCAALFAASDGAADGAFVVGSSPPHMNVVAGIGRAPDVPPPRPLS